ncbi:hypothetical protein JCM24511_05192 [Saitozyma sp. JCM 24511]|nr:hypothetical protein JCM24511_05192 [Saitozyma sp. JCM 24511]
MVKLRVMISMELEGVTDVRPADDEFEYLFNIVCTSCREEHPKIVSIGLKDEAEISGSRGTASFVWRCGNCKKEHSASFIPPSPTLKSPSPPPYTGPSWSTFIALDCRGLEITGYHFSGRWVCKGAESGTPFEFELESEEGGGGRGEEVRWDDYDEKAGEAVGVSELKSKIERF